MLPPVPLSSFAEPRLLAQGAPTARLFHSQGPSNEVTRASVLFSCTGPFFYNCACARPWKNGLVQEATSVQPHDVPGPTPFVREGGFQATRKQPVYATVISKCIFSVTAHLHPFCNHVLCLKRVPHIISLVYSLDNNVMYLQNGQTPLIIASRKGHIVVVQLLLQMFADVSISMKVYTTL